ncbi:hypothetical protein ACFFKU_17865 [Kineococcus gynurae]|uniref:Uncharacterized protein n=1 Tax=Kineococcus gynurae TaxID=452979 RepID=A0ABV5LNK7_9ACTN
MNSIDTELARLEADLGPRLHRDLTRIAAQVPDLDHRGGGSPRASRPRRVVVLVATGVAALGLAAAGYGLRVPDPEAVLISGTTDGRDWWVQPKLLPDACGGPPLLGLSTFSDGSGWTGRRLGHAGVAYAEPIDTDDGLCAGDTRPGWTTPRASPRSCHS